jgi:hypothetical protein
LLQGGRQEAADPSLGSSRDRGRELGEVQPRLVGTVAAQGEPAGAEQGCRIEGDRAVERLAGEAMDRSGPQAGEVGGGDAQVLGVAGNVLQVIASGVDALTLETVPARLDRR